MKLFIFPSIFSVHHQLVNLVYNYPIVTYAWESRFGELDNTLSALKETIKINIK